ncbi:hypothetical protein BH23ACT2_BH23ACT2_24580 [soil metagenome]
MSTIGVGKGPLPAAPGIPPAPASPARVLTDRGAVALAVAATLAAWWHPPVPLAVGVVVVIAALAVRHPVLLVVGTFALAAALGVRAQEGLAPIDPAPYDGIVTLVSDPRETPFGMRVDVRVGDKRVEMEASNSSAGAVAGALAGERLHVDGSLSPPPSDAPWLASRHVVGRLRVDRAERVDGGAVPWRGANRFRRLLERGAETMPEPARVLYGGIVLGDRRGHTPGMVDDFRGSGLTHLLVVSGQNVAFVLVLVSPVTNRLPAVPRWAVTVGVIGAFALVTRFEPSVLRASAMAAIAVTAVLAGRPTSTVRSLALAVTALVLVDPLLVWSVGFQLSVAASAGIALLGRRLIPFMWGPAWCRNVLAITLAAQVGVAPVLIPRFGGLPVVSVAANMLTVPVKGLIICWGMPVGVMAGLMPPEVARVLHLPTEAMVRWVAGVARVSAAVPLGDLQATGMVAATIAGWGALLVARHRPRWRSVKVGCALVLVAAVLHPAWMLRTPPGPVEVAEGVHLHRTSAATVLVIDEARSPRVLLEQLRRAGVRRIDLVVASSEPSPEVLGALRHRWPVDRVLAVDDVGPVRERVGDLLIDAAPDTPTRVAHPP